VRRHLMWSLSARAGNKVGNWTVQVALVANASQTDVVVNGTITIGARTSWRVLADGAR